MREILFRGKCQTGEWVEGGFLDRKGKPEIIDFDRGEEGDFTFNTQVDSKTVGQFTGLTDKNGKKIFEGDILRFPAKDEYEKTTFVGYEVFYHDNDCADNHIGFQMNRMRFYGHLCGGECRAKLLPKYTSQMVIIGNIHDNPELLP